MTTKCQNCHEVDAAREMLGVREGMTTYFCRTCADRLQSMAVAGGHCVAHVPLETVSRTVWNSGSQRWEDRVTGKPVDLPFPLAHRTDLPQHEREISAESLAALDLGGQTVKKETR